MAHAERVQGFDPEAIRRIRRARGRSVEWLAVAVGRSGATMHRYERGESNPPACALERIAAALECEVSDFYFTDTDLLDEVVASRRVQGLPDTIEDRGTLAVIASVIERGGQ
jgi:transcriptional regulator with XRE-family HTH domain